MNRVALPALRGDDPLGFLATLGLLHVLARRCRIDCRVGWPRLGDGAVLESPLSDVDQIVEALTAWIGGLDPEERPVDPELLGFPLMRTSAVREPMRMSLTDAVALAGRITGADGEEAEAATAWYGGLVNQLAAGRPGSAKRVDDERELSPFVAIRGQQTVGQVFGDTLKAVRGDPQRHLGEALTRWRRVEGFSGANLDARAVRDAGVLQAEKVRDAGVPGATFLALQAPALCRLVGNGTRGAATLWQRPRIDGRRREWMVWPVWRPLLDVDAVRVLIEHPTLRLEDGAPRRNPDRQRHALGVLAVCAAPRERLNNADGPIGPRRILWPSRDGPGSQSGRRRR